MTGTTWPDVGGFAVAMMFDHHPGRSAKRKLPITRCPSRCRAHRDIIVEPPFSEREGVLRIRDDHQDLDP